MPRLFAILFCALLAAPAFAQDTDFTVEDDKALSACVDAARETGDRIADCIGIAATPCQDAPGGATTIGIAECYMRETGWWDRLLNDNYAAVLDTLDAERVESLRAAQRTWIAFRDAECAFRYDYWREGTIRTIVAASCMLDLTAHRAIDIGGILDQGA